jgi:lipopolysaccharide export system permease protein
VRRTLSIYIISEILAPFLFGLLAFTVLLLTARILRLIELVVTRGVSFLQIGKLFGLILPTFLEMTVPMAFLLAILFGLGRLSSDQELLALKVSGVGPVRILLPIAMFSLLVCSFTMLTTTWLRPAASLAMKKEIFEIAKGRIGTTMREKVFNNHFPKVLIYVEEVVPPGNTFQGMLIVDRRNPSRENVIISRVGLFSSDEESQNIVFKLFDGTVHEKDKKRKGFSQTRFNVYHVKLDLEETFGLIRQKKRGPKEMSLRRLVRTIRSKNAQGLKSTSELIELHQRLAFSFAPIVLGLLGGALVMAQTRVRASRPWGFAACLFWLLIYYALLSMGKALGEREILAPWLALWLPNLVVGLIATYYIKKAVNESPPAFQITLDKISATMNRKLFRRARRFFS